VLVAIHDLETEPNVELDGSLLVGDSDPEVMNALDLHGCRDHSERRPGWHGARTYGVEL
jgi:hypothetical protein